MKALLLEIIKEIRLLRESLGERDAAMSAAAAARYLGIGEHTLNRYIASGVGPEFYQMPEGRKFTKAQLNEWRDKRFLQRIEWRKAV